MVERPWSDLRKGRAGMPDLQRRPADSGAFPKLDTGHRHGRMIDVNTLRRCVLLCLAWSALGCASRPGALLDFDSQPSGAQVWLRRPERPDTRQWVWVGTTPCSVWIGPGFANDVARVVFPDTDPVEVHLAPRLPPSERRKGRLQTSGGAFMVLTAMFSAEVFVGTSLMAGGMGILMRGVDRLEVPYAYEQTSFFVRQDNAQGAGEAGGRSPHFSRSE